MCKRLLILLWCLALGLSLPVLAQTCPSADWPAWRQTQQRMVTYEGRVIDHSDPRSITTSEGQSYALFFALVNNDRALFDNLLQWTQTNLARGDLSSNLPAWLWGQTPNGDWDILDSNSASDSDLWIAYSLLEAARLWGVRDYATMGQQLLTKIAQHELVDLPGFGTMLLPAPIGFREANSTRLNPSYLPPQIVTRLAHQFGQPWQKLADNTPRFLMNSAPVGLAPDWISWVDDLGFKALTDREREGSYDAIRVYLWIGMLDVQFPHANALKQHFRAIGQHINAQGRVTEKLNILTGQPIGDSLAGPGFSAALLPLFDGQAVQKALLTMIEPLDADPLGYYNQMLILFGQGWIDQRYHFDHNGYLIPAWKRCP